MNKIQCAEQFAIEHETEALNLLKELVQIPAPSYKEEKRALFCKKWLEEQGAGKVWIDKAWNVICQIGGKENSTPLFLFMAHSDTVFPEETPLSLVEKGDRLYCPGIGDDTANVVALLMTVKYILTNKIETKEKGFLFVVNSGEEGLGNLKGSRQIFEDYGKRIKGMISFDVSGKDITCGAIGSKRYRITVQTEGGHSFEDFGKKNAIACLAAMIETLYAVKVPENSRTTFNVGTISGGTSVNTIAQQAEMLYEFRSDKREALAFMEENLKTVISDYRKKGIAVEVEQVGDRPCSGEVDEMQQRKLITAAASVLEANWGEAPKQKAASTDCNVPLSLGIPAVCVGCCQGGGVHTREEYVEKSSLLPGLKIATGLFMTIL